MAIRIIILSLLSIITIGCGNANSHEQSQKEPAVPTNGSGIVAGAVVPKLIINQHDNDVTLHFTLKNQTEHAVTYTFPTSQRFDYTITDQNGDVVKKFSEGRMFAQHVGTVTLKQGEEVTYDSTVSGLAKGSYLVTFWLTAKEDQFKTTTTFSVN